MQNIWRIRKMSKLAKLVRISSFIFVANLVCAKNLTPYELNIYVDSVMYSFTTTNQRIAREVGGIDDEFSNACLSETLQYIADIYRQIIEYCTQRMETYPNVPSGNYMAYFYQKGKAEYNKCVPRIKNEIEKERKRQAEQERQAKLERENFIKKMEKEGKVVAYFGDNSENRLIYKEYYENDEKIKELFDEESGTELKSKERFHPSGLLKWKERYSDGKINEKYIYNSNGKLIEEYKSTSNGKLFKQYEYRYYNNINTIEKSEFDFNGKLLKKYFYDLDGKLVERYKYDSDGDVIEEAIYGGTDYVTGKDGNAVIRSLVESKKSKESKPKKPKKSKKKIYYID